MIKRLVIALVLIVLVCGGLVGFNLFRSKMISEFFAGMQMPAVTVSATTIEPVTWTPEIDAIGTLFASQGVDVAAPIAGVVRGVEFNANDLVQEGELLVQIDDAVERADLAAAQTAVNRDRAALERAQTLSKRGVNSEATLETAEMTLAASQSTLARLQATIDLKAVEAPFAGTVGIPRVDVGQYVQPGTVIATLQQLGTMRVDFTIPEQRLADLQIGQPASFDPTGESFPFEGRIVGIDPKVDPQTRLVALRAELENPGGELRPGQFVRVRVGLPPVADVIALPQTAVVTSLYGDYVYLVQPAEPQPGAADAGAGEADAAAEAPDPAAAPAEPAKPQLVAKQVFVKVGHRQGNLIQVVEGLQPGQTVVTSGQNKLANNMPVVIDNAVDPAAIARRDGEGAT
jgi:membrane fusion protein (multidrug efflux system)